jgi:uncharacterized membrane protein
MDQMENQTQTEQVVNQTQMNPATPDKSGKATASFVLGLVSILGCIIPFVGVVTSIIGIVMGAKGLKSSKRTMAIIGLSLSIIFLVVSIVVWIGATIAAMGQINNILNSAK